MSAQLKRAKAEVVAAGAITSTKGDGDYGFFSSSEMPSGQYTSDTIRYATSVDWAKMNDYKKISGVEPVLIKEFDRFSDQNITKILWYDEPGNLRKWTEDFGKEEFSQVTCCISQPVFLEFFHSQVSKAAAMQKIGERYGISREEMIAVGDGPNDIEMLEYAGLGIAMGNAAEEVKRHAGSVTASNDDEGVLQVIRKYF